MKKLFITLFIALSSVSHAQQSTGLCDSIIIDSLQFHPNISTALTIQATNLAFAIDVVSYPGFILFNSNGDTIAKENVNYFGIGPSAQTHTLQIINNPVSLPMSGYIELYSNFYDSLRCTFAIVLNDSLASIFDQRNVSKLNVSPNPSNGSFFINGIKDNAITSVLITDQNGRIINTLIKNGNEIDLSEQKSGFYFLDIQHQGSIQRLKLIKL